MKLGHFDKHMLKTQEEKGPRGNILEDFLLDTRKTTFWMENLTQRWTLSGSFFPPPLPLLPFLPGCMRKFVTKEPYSSYNIIFDLYQYNIQPTNNWTSSQYI